MEGQTTKAEASGESSRRTVRMCRHGSYHKPNRALQGSTVTVQIGGEPLLNWILHISWIQRCMILTPTTRRCDPAVISISRRRVLGFLPGKAFRVVRVSALTLWANPHVLLLKSIYKLEPCASRSRTAKIAQTFLS